MPTHPMTGPDYSIPGSGALSGERIAKDSAPATAFEQYAMNAIWHGLRFVVKEMQISGDLTAASGSADQTEGFFRLSMALRRMARRYKSGEVVTKLMTSPGYTAVLTSDVYVYTIGEDGGGPYGDDSAFYPDTTNPTMNNYRLILIVNGTAQSKLVGDSASQKYARLMAGESCFFYGIPNSGATLWKPIGKDIVVAHDGTVSIKLFGGTSAASSAVTLEWFHHAENKLVTVSIPAMQVTLDASDALLTIFQAAGTSLPVEIRAKWSDTTPRIFLVLGDIGGTPTIFRLTFGGASGTVMQIEKQDGSSMSNGSAVTLYGFEITYLLKQ